MTKYNFAVCTVNRYFDVEMDQGMCTVDKPLQLFETERDADEAIEILNQFYDYELAVVHILNLHDSFR